jgi:hypothetical protein
MNSTMLLAASGIVDGESPLQALRVCGLKLNMPATGISTTCGYHGAQGSTDKFSNRLSVRNAAATGAAVLASPF